MVALAFLVPLAFLARQIAIERAVADARSLSGSVVAVLAVSEQPDVLARAVAATGADDRLVVDVPGQQAVGAARSGTGDRALVRAHRSAITTEVPGGLAYLQPVALDGDRIAVVEVFVPDERMHRGVNTTWASLACLAAVLVRGRYWPRTGWGRGWSRRCAGWPPRPGRSAR